MPNYKKMVIFGCLAAFPLQAVAAEDGKAAAEKRSSHRPQQ
jgi:hypothetical protein